MYTRIDQKSKDHREYTCSKVTARDKLEGRHVETNVMYLNSNVTTRVRTKCPISVSSNDFYV